MVPAIDRQEVLMPGGIELTREAEPYLGLGSGVRLLSVACGTGELELYLVEKYGCHVTGVDLNDAFIRKAREKTKVHGLTHLATFEVGDGNALGFDTESFDALFCCGALCAFFESGLCEFRRVLKRRGRAAVAEIVWRKEDVPPDVQERWAEGTAHILTLKGSRKAFSVHGFDVIFAEGYHEPSWWEAYYADRGTAPHWMEERENYHRDQAWLGLGLFILERRENR